MAKERYIDTKFWDDNYIVKLDPVEKLLFIYFLTNPLTNICGVYEISLRRIAFDTGIEEETISTLLKRFEDAKKIKYKSDYIAVRNFTKYQKDNPKINKGIILLIKHIPKELLKWVNIDYDRLCIDPDTLSHLNTNTNTNNNINKYKYMDHVYLTKEEHQKLMEKFGESKTKNLITDLNLGIGSKGYKYKSHYMTILNWERRSDKGKPKIDIDDINLED